MITFYATIAAGRELPKHMPVDVPYLCPASSWYRVNLKAPRLPAGVTEVAADCGGFVATRKWNGVYRYTPEQYVTWLRSFNPSWSATMDFCCEDEITSGHRGIVRKRQYLTTGMAQMFWRFYRRESWAWVPTVQGWHVEDYIWHARRMKPLIEDMAAKYGADRRWRVGIGTLCNRANAEMVRKVVTAVSDELPNTPLHLWGVKLAVLQNVHELRNVVSVDSAAWSGLFGRGIEAIRNTCEQTGMTQREHDYRVALPRYLAKVERAVNQPKQKLLL